MLVTSLCQQTNVFHLIHLDKVYDLTWTRTSTLLRTPTSVWKLLKAAGVSPASSSILSSGLIFSRSLIGVGVAPPRTESLTPGVLNPPGVEPGPPSCTDRWEKGVVRTVLGVARWSLEGVTPEKSGARRGVLRPPLSGVSTWVSAIMF